MPTVGDYTRYWSLTGEEYRSRATFIVPHVLFVLRPYTHRGVHRCQGEDGKNAPVDDVYYQVAKRNRHRHGCIVFGRVSCSWIVLLLLLLLLAPLWRKVGLSYKRSNEKLGKAKKQHSLSLALSLPLSLSVFLIQW